MSESLFNDMDVSWSSASSVSVCCLYHFIGGNLKVTGC